MAGDWIKMRTSLLTNPRVNGIARILEEDREVSRALSTGFSGYMSEIVTRNVMRHVTVSSLLIVWGAANEHTRDGVFRNADLSDIDDMVGIPGFGEAMVAVGWASYDDESSTVTLPNFSEYNTSGRDRTANAKTAAERQREYRERKKSQESDVARDVTRDVTSDVTSNRREEKSREDKDKGTASAMPTPDGVSVETWQAFLKVRKAKRAPMSELALAGIQREADAAGWTLEAALTECVTRGWQSFKAEWVAKQSLPAQQNPILAGAI